ncbi:MAG: DUF971 domain-containing protein [Bacteroidota bacterium]
MEPIEITKIDGDKLKISWLDGFVAVISLKDLRDNCPCASCQGEQVGFKKFEPLKLDVIQPGTYEIESIEPIGNYAIQIVWKDGHDTGIYSFEYLRQVMEKFGTKI